MNSYEDVKFQPLIEFSQGTHPFIREFYPEASGYFSFQATAKMPVMLPFSNYYLGESFPRSIPIPITLAAPTSNYEIKNLNMGIQTPGEVLNELNIDLEDDNNSSSKNKDYTSDIDSILIDIENNNSAVINTFKAYRIPHPISKLLLKRIIRLTLMYYDNLKHLEDSYEKTEKST